MFRVGDTAGTRRGVGGAHSVKAARGSQWPDGGRAPGAARADVLTWPQGGPHAGVRSRRQGVGVLSGGGTRGLRQVRGARS